MLRLGGFETWLLNLETPTTYQHTLKIAVLVGNAEHPFDITYLRKRMRRRVHLLEPLRYVVARTPFDLHHPVWREHCEVDFDHHVREVRAPAPGGDAELDQVIGELMSSPLDRSRPLWQMYAVTGLSGDRIALVTKMHHALADGLASANLLARAVMSYPDEELAGYVPVPPDPVPDTRWAVRWALADRAGNLRALPGLVKRTARGVNRLRRHGPDPGPDSAKVLDPPRIFTNGALSTRRQFTTTTLPLAEVQRVRRALGVTMNDAILGIAAGAMRRMRLEVEGRSDVPLVATVPFSTSFDTERISGNRIGVMLTSLPAQIEDPVRRCRAASAAAKVAKERTRLLGPDLLRSWTEYVPRRTYRWYARRAYQTGRAARAKPQMNVVVSNVPGPKEQIQIAGWPVVGLYSVGPLTDGCGLNITIWSYRDELAVSVLSDPGLVTDQRLVTASVTAAFEELRDAVDAAGTPDAAPATPRSPAPPAPA